MPIRRALVRRWSTMALTVAILFSLGRASAEASRAAESPIPPDAKEARVLYVLDGDTIDVMLGGEKIRVRYIGIDTPELSDERPDIKAMARESWAANKGLVLGRNIWLHWDAERRDVFGRALAEVYVEPATLVNAWLVEQGYAYAFTVPPNVRQRDLYRALQKEARAKRRGLWARRSEAPPPPSLTDEELAPGAGRVRIVRLDLRDEVVTVRNDGPDAVDLTGWGLVSEGDAQRYTFPPGYVLEAGMSVRVWSSPRALHRPPDDLKWTGSYMWNNDGDAAVLVDRTGRVVSRFP